MYKINKSSNSIQRLEQKSFSSQGFRERDHLQEWIAKQPGVLEEDFLIIQKEYSGFYGTQERLDLLALDKQGALVIIENKLDDSGRDVTWQALKYASYCSRLSKAHITKMYQQYLDVTEPGANAEERVSDFMDGQEFEEIVLNKGVTQRIILIAAKFRKEVTSTVLWLMNSKVRIQCFRAKLFSMGEELFLNVEQIIPIPDAEDYMIGMAEKAQDDIESQDKRKIRQGIRKEFWSKLIPAMNATSSKLYQNINPRTSTSIGAASGVSHVRFRFTANTKHCQAELCIKRGDKSENEFVFDKLAESKSIIEGKFGGSLEWVRLDEEDACRIKSKSDGNIFDRDQWDAMIEFMTDAMCRLETAIKDPLKDVGRQVKNRAPTV